MFVLLSQSIKGQAYVLTFCAIALQILFMRAAARIADTHRQNAFLTSWENCSERNFLLDTRCGTEFFDRLIPGECRVF